MLFVQIEGFMERTENLCPGASYRAMSVPAGETACAHDTKRAMTAWGLAGAVSEPGEAGFRGPCEKL